MQHVDHRVVPGVASMRVDGVHLGFKNLVVVVQVLTRFLDDHEELNVALHGRHHALLPLFLVVGDVPGHLEQGHHVLIGFRRPPPSWSS